MRDGDPKPYASGDLALVTALEFEREDGNGDRFYTYPARVDKRATFANVTDQHYFYRAMMRTEADGWLSLTRDGPIEPGGHHGWASYRGYSKDHYLKRNPGYTHLLEVYAPDFISALVEIGCTIGKTERLGEGDISWGIGGKSSNGFTGSDETNKELKKVYAEYCNDGVEVNLATLKGSHRAAVREVAPKLFKSSIKWVKLVNFRSQKP